MELWEFNLFVEGKNWEFKERYKENISLAYHVASFVWSKKTRPLSSYLRELDSSNISKKQQKEKIEFAKKMSKKLERR